MFNVSIKQLHQHWNTTIHTHWEKSTRLSEKLISLNASDVYIRYYIQRYIQ